eukprot:TRINITY_DN70544_c0_g1_i1.p1 TRINITY_DN70544_c0_g1~~TRINITY_DN70544_c0_g1_i1.p1  ORF type:complete len:596 (-),score=120.54 TRINITY_DN70544_c0_g1_i1:132-1745(-)
MDNASSAGSDASVYYSSQGKKTDSIEEAAPVNAPVDAREAEKLDKNVDVVFNFQTPEFVELLFAATGIATLRYHIAQERDVRSGEYFQNPYPLVDAIVSSMLFESIVASMIILNSILLGVEGSMPPETDHAYLFDWFEYFFSTFFVLEWILRMIACGWIWLFEFRNFVDTCLVFAPLALIALSPFGVHMSGVRVYTSLRILRLMRLARTVRLVPAFKEMWILIHGASSSARPLLWVSVIAFAVLFVFSIAATELIGRNADYADDPLAQELFGDLMKSMFTMLQMLTLDSWCDAIARPLMRKNAELLSVFFLSFIGIGVFVFWNLITAIIVDSAFRIAKEDASSQAKTAEEDKRLELKRLADIFLEIDTDRSGNLTRQEFFSELENKKVKQMLDLLDLSKDELTRIWDILDDGDGELTIMEFTNGIRRMKGDAKSKDVIDIIKRIGTLARQQEDLSREADLFCASLQGLERCAAQISTDTDEVLGLFMEMHQRLAMHIQKGEKEDRRAKRQKEKEKQSALLAKLQEEEGPNNDGDSVS